MAAAVAATASSAKASAVTSPPDLTDAEKKVFEALKMTLGPENPLSPPDESDNLEKPSAKDMSDIAMLIQATGSSPAPRAESPPAKRPRAAPSTAPAPVVDLEDDLYGDITGPASNKAATTSTYASKIGSMLNADDF